MYLRTTGSADPLSGWVAVTKAAHNDRLYQCRPLPEASLSPAEHLQILDLAPTAQGLDGPLRFYYGLCGDWIYLVIFRQPETVKLAYSPDGAGSGPAWDFQTWIPDAVVGRRYRWDVRLVVKPFAGRRDILTEVVRYTTGKS